MIIKTFEAEKLKKNKSNLFLLYGDNEGFKNQIINKYLILEDNSKIIKYDESEVFEKLEHLNAEIKNKSFFEDKKTIIIKRASDKIYKIIEEYLTEPTEDLRIIINAGPLDKKSKLRNSFEKEKNLVCVPFYEDDNLTLSKLANTFFKEKKILISQESINLLVERSKNKRENLVNELNKIDSYAIKKKKVSLDDIYKLTNLSENYSYSQLCDQCLTKNLRKTTNILNENNYDNQDCIAIIRTMILKVKRLVKLKEENLYEKNIDTIVTNFKPPIFWKDKEIVKTQMKNWNLESARKLMYELNNLELLVKKNVDKSVNILKDFIISKAKVSN